MKLKYFMYYILVVISLGCSATKESVDAKLIEMQAKMMSTLTIADLKVKEKRVSATMSEQKKPQQNIDIFIKNSKKKALNQLQINCQADVLVETRFEVKLEKNNSITVRVSAYPAYYHNFRSISKESPESLKKLLGTEIFSVKPKEIKSK